MSLIARTPADYETFLAAPHASGFVSVIADPVRDNVPFIAQLEVFEPGAGTMAHAHATSHELIYVLAGEGVADIAGRAVPLRAGDSFCVTPGDRHQVRSTGPGKLYCLTVMIPREGSAETARDGERAILTPEDLAVLQRRVMNSFGEP